jgi:hypothetical protein
MSIFRKDNIYHVFVHISKKLGIYNCGLFLFIN